MRHREGRTIASARPDDVHHGQQHEGEGGESLGHVDVVDLAQHDA